MIALFRRVFAPLALLFALLAGPAAASEARPALWKVADEDTTIWLFGTVHALPADLSWYRGEVAIAFEGSDELVTEIDAVEPARMQAVVLEKAVLPRGQSLRDQLASDQRARLEDALRSLGLPLATMDRFEPWYAAIALATLPIQRSGYVADHGVENVLATRARALGKPRGALGTPEYQLGLFDELPDEVQKRYLMEIVRALPELSGLLGRIVEAWTSGDADKLAVLMHEQEDDPAIMEALMFRRNRAWADWIAARLEQPGEVFLAVGAGHLAGPGSVQDELAARGVAVRRVQ
ncbi:MAG TPA: TraB/GumN family protein [Novosphingobium sp.]|nr:TraB/GumN family protein [Novosphingobium sp.]